jgi:iron complex transport system permease protein
VMRLVTGPRHERLLPACLLGGATLMVLADVAARMAHTAEVPVGIVTAFIGCPFFLYLLRRTRARASP